LENRIGQQFGNYQLSRLLGHGGFAEVYLGDHVYLKSQAAIKVLTEPLVPGAASKFLNEAQTLMRLTHPHIVRLLDFGIKDQTSYLVMEYAPGGTLRERYRHGEQLPLPTIVKYIKGVAEALQFAHDQHLIHRDVKPANLLLDRQQEVLLSDFGIAVIAHGSRSQWTEGIMGTISYMAPEQIHGKPCKASDQYALGVIAYEWLTGHRPFSGSFVEIAAQHCMENPPLLSVARSHIPYGVKFAVWRALAKRPEKRYESVQAFASAFEQATQMTKSEESVLSDYRPDGRRWTLEEDLEGISAL
jgi:serine/threonine protein kinase